MERYACPSSGNSWDCSNPIDADWVGVSLEGTFPRRAFFRGVAFTILSIDPLLDLNACHVTWTTRVELPAGCILDFAMSGI